MRFEWPDPEHEWQPKNPSDERIWEIVEISDKYKWKGDIVTNWKGNLMMASPVGHPKIKELLSFNPVVSDLKWVDKFS